MEDDPLLGMEGRADCELEPPAGRPQTGAYALPEDLAAFYDRCGGALVYARSPYVTSIMPPARFGSTDVMMWMGTDLDESDYPHPSWFLVADDDNGNYISIDLAPNRLGWCYDTQIGRYGSPGDCPIVAWSFAEFLRRTLAQGGRRYYWVQDDFVPHGDAYDEDPSGAGMDYPVESP